MTLEANLGIAGANNAGAEAASGDYLVFLNHDDLLAPSALAWLSVCAPEADLIYTDEDKIDEDGAHYAPVFKPAWSPRLLLGINYVNHLMSLRTKVFRELGGFAEGMDGVDDHDLLIRLSERPTTVAHLPNILYHWRIWRGSTSQQRQRMIGIEQLGLEMVNETIRRRGWHAHPRLGNGMPYNYRVVFDAEPQPPLVKIVMPSRDRAEMLRTAVEGALSRTDDVRTHLVIVDNGSRQPAALEFLESLLGRSDVTVLHVDEAFNFSRLCNQGASVGPEAPLLLFLNNDVEIRHRQWLLQLTGWLRDPEVVGAGPMLLYPDGTIQHAGVMIGFRGTAGHYARNQPNKPALNSLHDQAREVSCLTGACLLVRTSDYRAVGGMSEDLAVVFQDVDLCLRLHRATGGVFVHDPTFPLIHHESATRGDLGAEGAYTIARMRFLWGPQLHTPDPYYNPHLNNKRYDVVLGPIPEDPDERLARVKPRFFRPPSA